MRDKLRIFGELATFLREELAIYPGRTESLARTLTACVVTAIAVLAFQIPNGFLAVFYVIAISREAPQSVVRNGFAVIMGNIAGLALALAGMVLFTDYPLAHFLFVITVFFLAFFLIRTMTNYSLAFGFSIILVAASSVNIIWSRPNPLYPDVNVTLWTSFGMVLGTIATVVTDWLFLLPKGTPADGAAPGRIFVPDAFSNPAYQSFALKGCLAAAICYVIWSALAWPGLGVCTVTCVIAAPLATPGSSRRRLATRLLGLFTGGVICGIGSQIFILPLADSVIGFILPFAAVSAAAAWIVTSGPAFAYFGRQMALAYYLTMFQGWGVGASLGTSRDRLMGVLLGVLVMWLVFDAAAPQRQQAPGAAVIRASATIEQ